MERGIEPEQIHTLIAAKANLEILELLMKQTRNMMPAEKQIRHPASHPDFNL